MKFLLGSLPLCFTDDFGVDEVDPALYVLTIFLRGVRTGTVTWLSVPVLGGLLGVSGAASKGLISCILWAMNAPGLVKMRVATIFDTVVL